MQELSYNFIDKKYWPRGEWDNEFDKVQYTDEKTGLPCLIVRHPTFGHLCGYVGVNKSHPLFKKDYNAIDIDVHGGLTFSNKCQDTEHGICHKVETGEDNNIWWFGFDCAHAGDCSPGMEARFALLVPPLPPLSRGDVYKNIDYVKKENSKLAQQLKSKTQNIFSRIVRELIRND